MSAVPARADGDGRVTVSLAELLALRARVGRVRPLPLDTRAAQAGQQSSRLYGRGMDYAESRVYQPGDDVRRLDWRLTARSGELHTKLFQEEREGRLLILLDKIGFLVILCYVNAIAAIIFLKNDQVADLAFVQ